jgi:hypothetical protein
LGSEPGFRQGCTDSFEGFIRLPDQLLDVVGQVVAVVMILALKEPLKGIFVIIRYF